MADVASTALLVMGPAAGLQWVDRQAGIDALFLIGTGPDLRVRHSPGMTRWLIDLSFEPTEERTDDG